MGPGEAKAAVVRYGLTQPLPELSRIEAKKADWARR
jgi:hypothetical protein